MNSKKRFLWYSAAILAVIIIAAGLWYAYETSSKSIIPESQPIEAGINQTYSPSASTSSAIDTSDWATFSADTPGRYPYTFKYPPYPYSSQGDVSSGRDPNSRDVTIFFEVSRTDGDTGKTIQGLVSFEVNYEDNPNWLSPAQFAAADLVPEAIVNPRDVILNGMRGREFTFPRDEQDPFFVPDMRYLYLSGESGFMYIVKYTAMDSLLGVDAETRSKYATILQAMLESFRPIPQA